MIGVFAWSYLAAPAEMDGALRETLGRTTAAPTLDDVIRLFDQHIDKGRPLGRRLIAVVDTGPARRASDEDIARALYAIRDWLKDGLELVSAHCISRRQDYLVVWRAVPTTLRKGTEIIPASTYAKTAGSRQLGEVSYRQSSANASTCWSRAAPGECATRPLRDERVLHDPLWITCGNALCSGG